MASAVSLEEGHPVIVSAGSRDLVVSNVVLRGRRGRRADEMGLFPGAVIEAEVPPSGRKVVMRAVLPMHQRRSEEPMWLLVCSPAWAWPACARDMAGHLRPSPSGLEVAFAFVPTPPFDEERTAVRCLDRVEFDVDDLLLAANGGDPDDDFSYLVGLLDDSLAGGS